MLSEKGKFTREVAGKHKVTVKGRGAIRADFGPKSEINFVAITI